MDQSSSGDTAAGPRPPEFPDFVASRGRQLLRTAFLLTGGDSYLAEDLVQEALGRVFVKWSRISRLENPNGYAQTVLVNTFLSHRRRRSASERSTAEFPDTAVDDPDPALRLTLLRALGGIPVKDRAVLVLRYWEDRSVEETAAALNLSSTAVRSRSTRALARMRDLVGDATDPAMRRVSGPGREASPGASSGTITEKTSSSRKAVLRDAH